VKPNRSFIVCGGLILLVSISARIRPVFHSRPLTAGMQVSSASQPPSSYPEFTAYLTETNRDKTTGVVAVTVLRTVAVRATGDRLVLREIHYSDGTVGYLRELHAIDGTYVQARDELQKKVTYRPGRSGHDGPLYHADPSTDCVKTYAGGGYMGYILTGHNTVLGIPVTMFQFENNVVWKAPSLRCEILYQFFDFPDQATELSATRIVPGTPDPTLFSILDNYAGASPSDFKASLVQWMRDHSKGERNNQ